MTLGSFILICGLTYKVNYDTIIVYDTIGEDIRNINGDLLDLFQTLTFNLLSREVRRFSLIDKELRIKLYK